jgi:hypothetical protein
MVFAVGYLLGLGFRFSEIKFHEYLPIIMYPAAMQTKNTATAINKNGICGIPKM